MSEMVRLYLNFIKNMLIMLVTVAIIQSPGFLLINSFPEQGLLYSLLYLLFIGTPLLMVILMYLIDKNIID